MPLEPHRHIRYPSLHDLSAKFPPVDWLWPSWIPRGMLTLLGAAPGVFDILKRGSSAISVKGQSALFEHNRDFTKQEGSPHACPSALAVLDQSGA